jgi:hypothetical protein
LESGAKILDPVLSPHGFRWRTEEEGKGSGGHYARGAFIRGDRRLELHFRWSLGLVTYSMAALVITHVDYMRAAVSSGHESQYPGFSDEPLDGFRHLAHDVLKFGSVFLTGSDEEFQDLIIAASRAAETASLKKLP